MVPRVRGSGCHSVAGRTVKLPEGWNIVSERRGRARFVLPRGESRPDRFKGYRAVFWSCYHVAQPRLRIPNRGAEFRSSDKPFTSQYVYA